MKHSGPDSTRGWIIAVACCFINMMMYGMARLSGVLFVASMPRYNVGREQASFPYTFASFMRNTSGPLVGYLGEKLGVRLVTTLGCLLAAIGVATSFFAENINTVLILYGIVFGLGFGLGNILLPIPINQYFDKYRASASGLSFSGACIGSFILPLIVENLVNLFGLSGTFLILGGLVLNCVPAALLLRKPDFTIKSAKPNLKEAVCDTESQSITAGKKVKLYTVEDGIHVSSQPMQCNRSESLKSADCAVFPTNYTSLSYEERIKRLSTQTLLSTYSVRMSSPDPLDIEQILENSKGRRQVDQEAVECEVSSMNSSTTDSVFGKDNQISVLEDDKDISSLKDKLFIKTIPPYPENCMGKDNFAYQLSNSCLDLYVNNPQNGYYNEKEGNFAAQHTISYSLQKNADSGSNAFSIIFDPLFLLVAITNAIYCFTFVCMFTVIVDFAKDINVSPSNEKYILMSVSVGDLIGRLGLGWVTDGGYMTTTNFAAACFLCQGVTITAVGWSTGFPMLVSLAALYGLSEAGLIVIYPLIMAEYIDEDKQTVAISSSNFLAGPLCLAIAPLIGFFRDKIGSYEYIFIGMGVISVLCCFAWLLSPRITKKGNSTK